MSAELARDLTESEARALTDEIKLAAERVWALLLAAHERRAWAALGYTSWEQYVRAEFDMSRSRSFEVLNQGHVIRAITGAVGNSIDLDLSTADARMLEPELPRVLHLVRERGTDSPPEQTAEMVREVVAKVRQEIQQQRTDRQALDQLADELDLGPVDEHAENARIEVTHGFYRAVQALATLPPAAEVAALIPTYQTYRLADLPAALAWLTDFAHTWEGRT